MKNVFKALTMTGLMLGLCSFASAATMTMKGTISDSNCGLSHAKMTSSHAGLTDKACTLGCVKNGAKFVFVAKGKVYKIANQDLADLAKNAGDSVSLTGDFNGDTVTVAKLTMAKK
jgi:hypothetical protein